MAPPEETDDLFSGVVFFVDDSVAAENRPALVQDLTHRGGTPCPPPPPLIEIETHDNTAAAERVHARFDLQKVTHIISETWEIPERALIERHERRGEICTVTPQWHIRSRLLYLQEPSQYSPDPRMIFSGVFVSCLIEMAPSDIDQIYATVSAFGGGYRAGVTSDVTHIVTRKVEPSHFNTIDATKLGMIFVHPQWIIDCVKLGKRLPSQPYVFESAEVPPPILRPEWHADPSQHPSQHMTNLLKQQAVVSMEQESAWRSVGAAEAAAAAAAAAAGKRAWLSSHGNRVFEGKKIIFGCHIEISPEFRVALEEMVAHAGAVVLAEERLRDCDIYVTPWREGKQYLRAVKYGKTVATLPWVNHVIKVNRLTAPKDNLLHYPYPKGGVPGLNGCTISVTNYTGESRDYLKRLISAMGATFTTTLGREANTHLIAATKSGEKVSRAGTWHIPVLNHLYLEDCFIKWKHLSEAGDDRYTVFPHGVNFMTLLGNAELTDTDLERWTAAARDIDDDDDMQEIDGDITATGITPPTQLTEASQRDRTIRHDPAEDVRNGMDMDVNVKPSAAPPISDAEYPAQQMDQLEGKPQRESRLSGEDAEPGQPVPRGAADLPPPNESEPAPEAELAREKSSPDSEFDAGSNVDARMVDKPMHGHDVQLDVEMVNHNENEGMLSEPGGAAMPDLRVDAVENEAKQVVPEPSGIALVVEPATSPISDPPAEEEPAPPEAQAVGKGKVPAMSSKKSRPVAASTTQISKRRRVSTPEKPEAEAAEPPVAVQSRVRRQAASKAADMLHNVIAPDMALHEKEKKRKDIVSPKSRRAARVGALEEGSSRLSKEPSVSEDETPTEDETDLQVEAKNTHRGRKKATSTRGRSRSTLGRDTARSRLATRSVSVLSGLAGENEDLEGDLIGSQVRLMCTGYNLDDKTSRALRSLGVRFTEKPLDMTHLVGRRAMRTHKLLVGLAKGVDVLSVEWLEKCVELKRLIDPSQFILQDKEAETKGGFVLADSIRRSRELHQSQGGLFAGKLFHITGRVKPDFDQIKDVVKAAGGDITRYISGKTRIPKDDQDPLILISCEEDRDIWENLLEDEYNVVVHDKELLFASILKMELNMDEHKLEI